jgi:hypothetical protein
MRCLRDMVLGNLKSKTTSKESITESIRFEKEHFTNTLELSKQLNKRNISALIGLRNSGKDSITDFNGKYETD